MSSPAEPSILRRSGLYALLTMIALPVAAVILWIAVMLVVGGTGATVADVVTIAFLAATVVAAILIGVRWRIRAWLIVVSCVVALFMWIPIVFIALLISRAVDGGDDGGYYPGGVILALLG